MQRFVVLGWRVAALVGAMAVFPAEAARQAQGPAQVPRVTLTAARSTVITTDFDITRIAITNPAIADAVVVQPREILVDGKSPGTVSLIVWGATRRDQYDVVVEPGVTGLQQQLQSLFPGEDIRVCAPARSRRPAPRRPGSSTCCSCPPGATVSRSFSKFDLQR